MDKPSHENSSNLPPTEQKIPHGGERPDFQELGPLSEAHAPRLISELQARDSVPDALIGRTSIEDAADRLSKLSQTTTYAPETTETADKPKKSRKGLFIGVGAGVVAAATGVALAVGLNLPKDTGDIDKNEPPVADPKATSEPAPVETAAPAPQTPELVTSLESLDWQSFEAQPRTDQLAYVDYNLKQNMERHTIAVGKRDRTNWTEPSRDMSGQQIVDNFNYILDEAGTSTVFDADLEKHLLDHNQAIKMLSGAYYETSDALVTNAFINNRDFILSQEKGYFTDQKQVVIGESEIRKHKDQRDNPIELKDITIQDQQGNQFTQSYVYVEYLTVDKKLAVSWLQYSQHTIE